MKITSILTLLSIVYIYAFLLGICHNAGYDPKSDTDKAVCIDLWVGQGHKL